MKQKARERMQPKMGKLDIDYQVIRVWGGKTLIDNGHRLPGVRCGRGWKWRGQLDRIV